MGYKNSPAIFQRLMDKVLGEEIGKSCYVYVDDILVTGKSRKEHDENLTRVVSKLVKAGIKGNRDKCEFGVQEIEFLGHKIKEDQIYPIKEKIDTIQEYNTPIDQEGIRRFLGLVNYYRKFIPRCAEYSAPLTTLLKKGEPFIWGIQQEEAMKKIKRTVEKETNFETTRLLKVVYPRYGR